MIASEYLSIYLNDHLAGANAAVEVVDNLAAEAPALAAVLAELRTDIVADRQQLKVLMASFEIVESQIRKAGSWFAEAIVEMKLELDDHATGPLRRFERLEGLAIGIDGKAALWQALNAAGIQSKNAVTDYETLTRRALDQRARVEVLRLQSAGEALHG